MAKWKAMVFCRSRLIRGPSDKQPQGGGRLRAFPDTFFSNQLSLRGGHAGQAHGEPDIPAVETSPTGTFQLIVRKHMRLRRARAGMPPHYMNVDLHEDAAQSTKLALHDRIDFLLERQRLQPR